MDKASWKNKKEKNKVHYLTYKKISIKGFSIFCDYDDVDLRKNGGIDHDKLAEELKENGCSYFRHILKSEFGAKNVDPNAEKEVELCHHKYLIQNFQVTLNLQINKDVKNPAIPFNFDHPQLQGQIIVGDENELKNP